ncbi:ABC transporter permease [Paenibacillus alginolyticus]|uniref:ABC transporter permease n=1 Tax=Paenibacillus alginolyticus TaxID=59839 RepID=UPI0004265537|nr:ABC transporter permease [Paenibacillus alginolyticus]MCY9668705.1 ABC transporter permease [Paenibacillus alginolyticus]
MKSLIDEWHIATGGKAWISILAAPLVAALFFGLMFSRNQISEASVAVIDLDHSLYSSQIIEKIDSSQYMKVTRVNPNHETPETLLANEKEVAVVVLPEGLESQRSQGKSVPIGFLMDNAMPSALTNIRTAIQEIVATENTSVSAAKLGSLGLDASATAGILVPLSMQQRFLFNPTSSFMNSMVLGFVNIVVLMVTTSAAGAVGPRLRREGKMAEEAAHPIRLLYRAIPYAVLSAVSLMFSYGLLKQLGGLRFEAAPYVFILPLFFYTLAMSLLGMLVSWTVKDQSKISLRTSIILYPSFLVTGIQIAPSIFPKFFQWTAMPLPMNWLNKLFRGMALRGESLLSYSVEIGALLIIIGFVVFLLGLLSVKEMRMVRQTVHQGVSF